MAASLLRVLLTMLGAVALAAGLYGVATGIEGMAGDSAGTTNVDSEIRFFAAVWAAYGIVALWTARRSRPHARTVLALMAVLFCAGLARSISWLDAGRPDTPYLVLLAFELGLPPLAVALQAKAGPGPG